MIVAVHRRLDAGVRYEGINGNLAQWIDAAGLLYCQAQAVSANLACKNSRLQIELVAVAVTSMFASGAADALGYRVVCSDIHIVRVSGASRCEGGNPNRHQ